MFKWLCRVLFPASAFATADSDDARNPQRFIHVPDLGIVSKEELRAYQIPEEGVVDNLTLKTKGAEILDSILI